MPFSAVFRFFVVFVFVVLCIRRKAHVGVVFFAAALLQGVLFEMPLSDLLAAVFAAVFRAQTLTLAVIVSLILLLSSLLDESGQLKRLMFAVRQRIKSERVRVIVFPALIGLLPMPGGAIFSAPLVNEAVPLSKYTRERLAFFNYWFRHIWEYWWPLYPGVLLTCALSGVKLTVLIAALLPLTFIAVLLGLCFFGKSETPCSVSLDQNVQVVRIYTLFMELLPITIAIVPGLGLGLLFSHLMPGLGSTKEFGLILALLAANACTLIQNRLSMKQLYAVLWRKHQRNMVATILSIMIFSGVLSDSGAVSLIAREFRIADIPLPLVVSLLPLLVGLLTGISVAFVGSALPIILGLILSIQPDAVLLPYMTLAMISGFIGVLLSPMHICLILSQQFFATPLTGAYKLLWIPCLSIYGIGWFYFYFLQTLLQSR